MSKYQELILRNEQNLYNRLMELTDAHIDRVHYTGPFLGNEDKIRAVYDHFKQAIDPNNPARQEFFF